VVNFFKEKWASPPKIWFWRSQTKKFMLARFTFLFCCARITEGWFRRIASFAKFIRNLRVLFFRRKNGVLA
jgi:hypothetical protein